MKLLIIEDDIAYASTLARRLATKGFEAQLAHNASDALLTARSQQPDYILLDMKLGDDSGLELIEPLRNLLSSARIVLLTGYASIATAVEAIRRGADDYLVKPAASQSLIKALCGDNASEVNEDDRPMSPERLEWEHIQQVLAANEGNVSETARQLGMHRRTLQRKLQKKPVIR